MGQVGSTWNGEWNKIRKEFAKLIWDQIVGLSSLLDYMLTSVHLHAYFCTECNGQTPNIETEFSSFSLRKANLLLHTYPRLPKNS